MNKLVSLINSMNYNDLKLIQRDVIEGNLAKLINEKIKEFENRNFDDNKICPTCGINLNEKNKKFTLIFGSEDFKKKAVFDEIDCLSFFIEKLKNTIHK